MDVNGKTSVKSANALKEEEFLGSQHIRCRGRSNSPAWKKVLVYHCEEQTLKVQHDKKINKDRCWKLDLPKRNQVIIFIDPETESKPTIASRSAGGACNVELATLYLDRLGIIPRLLRSFGQLSTLYVMDASFEGPSKSSSQRIGI